MNKKNYNILTNIYHINEYENKLPNKMVLVKRKYLDFVFPEMYKSMCELKSKIDNRDYSKLWDKAKRKVNPYELVNVLGTNILQTEQIKKCDNYTPLSRAFFKMTEILLSICIIPDEYKSSPGVIANIAEGPGGFIEAIYKQRSIYDIKDMFYGITLQSKNRNIPGWNQLYRRKNHFLNNNKNVILKTGNLYNVKTILGYSKLFKNKKAWLVTGDGGFDYSNDFNNQEKNSRKILYAEITTTLLIQEIGGSMVCKMFDLFTKFSLQLVYLLTQVYKNVYIIKPLTSRPANSEKYIVATGFKGINDTVIKSMLNQLSQWDKIQCELNNYYFNNTTFSILGREIDDLKISNGFVIDNLILPEQFIDEIRKINISLTTNQKEYITKTLNYIKNYKKNEEKYKKIQKEYSKLWFNNYNILNKNNIFTSLVIK